MDPQVKIKQIQGRLLTPDEVSRIRVEEGLVLLLNKMSSEMKKQVSMIILEKMRLQVLLRTKKLVRIHSKGTDIDGLLLYANDLTPQQKSYSWLNRKDSRMETPKIQLGIT